MSRVYLGIDPGLDGAFALLTEKGVIDDIIKMPTTKIAGDRDINIDEVLSLLTSWKKTYNIITAVVEKVWGTPGKSPTSICSLCFGHGILLTALKATNIPNIEVSAAKWKNQILHDLDAREKDSSVIKALKLFPESKQYLIGPRGGRDHNKADALLMAEWLRRQSMAASLRY